MYLSTQARFICAGSLDLTAKNIDRMLESIGSPVALTPVDIDAATLVFDAPEMYGIRRHRVRSVGYYV